jgi:DNA-binding MurR/RpiR family transcriptional regulator
MIKTDEALLEKLLLKLTDSIKSGTPSERKIAKYIIEHLAELPFETAATLAVKLNLSPMTVGRFMRSMGYRQLSDIRESLRDPTAVPASMELLETSRADQSDTPLSSMMLQQITAIQGVYDMTRQAIWQTAINSLAASTDIFIVSSPDIVNLSVYFHSRLLECRPNVQHIQLGGFSFAALFDHPSDTSLLVFLDCEGSLPPLQRLARAARKAGYKILLITSRYYEWGPESADMCLTIPLSQSGNQNCMLQQISMIDFMLHSLALARDATAADRNKHVAEIARTLHI